MERFLDFSQIKSVSYYDKDYNLFAHYNIEHKEDNVDDLKTNIGNIDFYKTVELVSKERGKELTKEEFKIADIFYNMGYTNSIKDTSEILDTCLKLKNQQTTL